MLKRLHFCDVTKEEAMVFQNIQLILRLQFVNFRSIQVYKLHLVSID